MTASAAELATALAPAQDALLALLREVADAEVMPRFLRVRSRQKDDGTLFTEADLAAQHVLAEALPTIIDAPIVGEEMPEAEQRAAWAAGDGGLWTVDPIDGTTNFINGLPFFALSVAYRLGGRTRLAATYNPITREMFHARDGGGAWLNDNRLPLRETAGHLGRAVANIDYKRIPRDLADRLALHPPVYSVRNFGSSTLEWAYLAAGRLDVYLHGGQMPWDYAAGELLLAEAGGRAGSLTDDTLAGPLWLRPVVAAASPALYREWANWLRNPAA
ncbi:MAG TPA: inositol monophosphatase family protein [Rhodocyclaceae bacterium]